MSKWTDTGGFAPLVHAFPMHLSEDVHAVTRVMPTVDRFPFANGSVFRKYVVFVDGECLAIPNRLYNEEPSPKAATGLSHLQQAVMHCIYTRHHDGFVRQRHVSALLSRDDPWVIPYIVTLIGEYVLEIIQLIQQGLPDLEQSGSAARVRYGKFAAENHEFIDLTRQRVRSYWDCYYRDQYPDEEMYPGYQLVRAIRNAGLEYENERQQM